MTFSPDGSGLLVSPEAGSGRQLSFDHEGDFLARTGRVMLFDATTGAMIAPWDPGGPWMFAPVAWRQDRTLAIGTEEEEKFFYHEETAVSLWDIGEQEIVFKLVDLVEGWREFLLSPEGHTLALETEDGEIQLWDVASSERQVTIQPRSDGACSFSPDGSVLVMSGSQGGVTVWDAITGEERHRADIAESCIPVFAPSGNVFATRAHRTKENPTRKIYLWDAATGQEIRRFGPDESADLCPLAFSPDGRTLVSGAYVSAGMPDGSICRCQGLGPGNLGPKPALPVVQLWEVSTGRSLMRIEFSEWSPTVAYSPDGHTLALAIPFGPIRLYDTATGRQTGVIPPQDPLVAHLVFSKDGRLLASSNWDGSALVWSVANVTAPSRRTTGDAGLDQDWQNLGASDPLRVHGAFWSLIEAGAEAISFLGDRLRRHEGEVPDTLRKVTTDLDSDDFEVREAASAVLRDLGPDAEAALVRAMAAAPSNEARQRIETFLEPLRAPRVLPPGDRARVWRAIAVLERIGTKEARTVLSRLASHSRHAFEADEAQATLTHLEAREKE